MSSAKSVSVQKKGTVRDFDTGQLRRSLLKWYRRNCRTLPWRSEPTLYNVLISEFMLQQTRVDQAMPYYHRFQVAFPDFQTLSSASLERVLKLWEGLGYYSRAKNLHRTAQYLATLQSPSSSALDDCPGIGPYTRAAIGSIVFNEVLPVIDGNVNRVMARMLALRNPPQVPAEKKKILTLLKQWIAPNAPGDWNQALMELGAMVCTPRTPKCDQCPWLDSCRGRALGTPEAFPKKIPKPERPHKQIAAAIIRRKDGRILIAQRMSTGLLANLWEFPGGKLEPGETLQECCAREINEELGIRICVLEKVGEIKHAYSHFSITLHAFECRYVSGRPQTKGCQAWKWVWPAELFAYPFPKANWDLVKRLSTETNKRH